MIMSSSITYLTTRVNFLQVSPDVPITKSRNPDKFDPPDVLEGASHDSTGAYMLPNIISNSREPKGACPGFDDESEAD